MISFNKRTISADKNNEFIWRRKHVNIINVVGYRIDLYFHELKLAIEIDENGHSDRSLDYEMKSKRL